MSGDAGGGDHVTIAELDQMGHEGAYTVHHAPKVDTNRPVPVVVGDRPQSTAGARHPGVQAHDMRPSERIDRRVEKCVVG